MLFSFVVFRVACQWLTHPDGSGILRMQEVLLSKHWNNNSTRLYEYKWEISTQSVFSCTSSCSVCPVYSSITCSSIMDIITNFHDQQSRCMAASECIPQEITLHHPLLYFWFLLIIWLNWSYSQNCCCSQERVNSTCLFLNVFQVFINFYSHSYSVFFSKNLSLRLLCLQ